MVFSSYFIWCEKLYFIFNLCMSYRYCSYFFLYYRLQIAIDYSYTNSNVLSFNLNSCNILIRSLTNYICIIFKSVSLEPMGSFSMFCLCSLFWFKRIEKKGRKISHYLVDGEK